MARLSRREKPTDFAPVYHCPGCDARYTTQIEAIRCSKSDETPVYKPGDIIYIDVGYGWFDGDEKWLKKVKEKGRLGRPEYGAFFVVTAITQREHEAHYHVKTLGIINGHTGHNGKTKKPGLYGWTGANHYLGKLVKNRPDLEAEGAEFVGEIYEDLL